MSKKTLILVVSLVLSLAVGLGGSLAYLTDRDDETNIFTVGNVAIDLVEDFNQNSTLMPNVEINKDAWIVNEGNNSAYTWMTVAVPAEVHDAIDLAWTDDADPEGPVDAVDADGNEYKVYTVKIEEALEPGDSTPVLLDSVTLKPNVDFQDGQFVVVENGVATPIDYDLKNVEIPVSAFAIQSEGFENFDEAYEAYGEQWGDFIVVKNSNLAETPEMAQEMLDNGASTIVLAPGVDYGTLYLRQNVDNPAVSQPVNSSWAGGGHTYVRNVNGLTIIGAEGAVVDTIKVEAAAYAPGGNEHSQNIQYLDSTINIYDLTLKNITFSGEKTALSLASQHGIYDGITIDGCNMDVTGSKVYLFVDDSSVDNSKNLTITGCEVNGAYQVIELRPTQGVTITNNKFTNTQARVILMSGGDDRYADVKITGNVADGMGDRFLRATKADGIVVTGNTVTNYNGADNDIIKIDNSTDVTVDGNTLPDGYTISQ